MKKYFLFFIFLGFLGWTLFAGSFDSFYSFSARSLGLGRADVALADDLAAIVVNPAGLVQIKNVQIGATYSDFYQTEGLFNVNAGFAQVFDFNAVGFFWNELALNSVYREDTVKICFARQLNNNFAFGLNGVLYCQSLNRSDMAGLLSSNSALSFDAGVLWQMNSRITGGVMIENISGSRVGLVSDSLLALPTVARVGVNFQILAATNLLLQLQSPQSFSAGGEINFSDLLSFRLGWNRNYPTVGVGLKINWVRFDFGMLTNSELGNVYRLSFLVDL